VLKCCFRVSLEVRLYLIARRCGGSSFWNAGFVSDLNVATRSAQDPDCFFLITLVLSLIRQRFQSEGDEEKKDDGGAEDEGSDSLSVVEVIVTSGTTRAVVALCDKVSDVEAERSSVEVQ